MADNDKGDGTKSANRGGASDIEIGAWMLHGRLDAEVYFKSLSGRDMYSNYSCGHNVWLSLIRKVVNLACEIVLLVYAIWLVVIL